MDEQTKLELDQLLAAAASEIDEGRGEDDGSTYIPQRYEGLRSTWLGLSPIAHGEAEERDARAAARSWERAILHMPTRDGPQVAKTILDAIEASKLTLGDPSKLSRSQRRKLRGRGPSMLDPISYPVTGERD